MSTRALESNAFQTSAASADYINPEVWVRQIEDFAKSKLVMAPLGKVLNDLLGSPGDTINEQFNVEITAAALTESTAITPSAISYTQVTYTPSEAGLAVTVTRKEKLRAIQDIFMEKTRDMGYALAKFKDNLIFTKLDAASVTTVTANNVAVSAIASSDVFNTDMIADGIAAMQVAGYEPRYLVIHPYQQKALMKLDNFIDASVYGGREVVLNGELGRYLGVRVLMSQLVPTNATTSTAKNAYLLDQDAFGIAYKMGVTFDSVYKPLERETILTAVEDFGVSVRITGKIVRMIAYAQ